MLWTEREKNKKDEESKGENWPSDSSTGAVRSQEYRRDHNSALLGTAKTLYRTLMLTDTW